MRIIHNLFCLLFVIVALTSLRTNAKTVSVKSPDGKTEFILGASENLSYSVIFNSTTILENGKLGLKVEKSPEIGKYLEIVESITQEVNNTWQPIQKQHESIVNHYNELSVDLEEIKFPERKLKVIVRAYNDGVAFCYVVPFGANRQKCNLEKESVKTQKYLYTEYLVKGERVSHMLYNHENDKAENNNVADAPENKTIVQDLQKLLRK